MPRRRPTLGAPRPAERALVTPGGRATRRGHRDRSLGARRALAHAIPRGRPPGRDRDPAGRRRPGAHRAGRRSCRPVCLHAPRGPARCRGPGRAPGGGVRARAGAGAAGARPGPAGRRRHGPLDRGGGELLQLPRRDRRPGRPAGRRDRSGRPPRGLGPVRRPAGRGARRSRGGIPAVQLVAGQRLPGGHRQLFPGIHARGSPAPGPVAAAVAGRGRGGREPVAVPGRRDVDPRRPCSSRRAPLRGAPRAPLPEAGPALGPREGDGGDRVGLDGPDRAGGPLVAQPGAAVGVGGVRPRPRSLRRRVEDGAVRRTSRGDGLALAGAAVVRERTPTRLHPGPGRAADLGVLLRRARPALRGPDPARERADLPALPAALPRDPALAAPRLRPAPLVLPPLGLLRGHAGRDGDGGRHRRVRGRLLLPPDPRPAPLGAGPGVLPDGEPRRRLPLLAAPREQLAPGPEPLALGRRASAR